MLAAELVVDDDARGSKTDETADGWLAVDRPRFGSTSSKGIEAADTVEERSVGCVGSVIVGVTDDGCGTDGGTDGGTRE